MLNIKGHDPVTGKEIDVYISYERLQAIAKRSRGQIRETAELVPLTLQCRGPVFEGLCVDGDEDRRGVGWRCYCSSPDYGYTQEGDRCPPRAGQVYLVFVNEDRVAYNWRWERAHPDHPELPLDLENRFKRRLA